MHIKPPCIRPPLMIFKVPISFVSHSTHHSSHSCVLFNPMIYYASSPSPTQEYLRAHRSNQTLLLVAAEPQHAAALDRLRQPNQHQYTYPKGRRRWRSRPTGHEGGKSPSQLALTVIHCRSSKYTLTRTAETSRCPAYAVPLAAPKVWNNGSCRGTSARAVRLFARREKNRKERERARAREEERQAGLKCSQAPCLRAMRSNQGAAGQNRILRLTNQNLGLGLGGLGGRMEHSRFRSSTFGRQLPIFFLERARLCMGVGTCQSSTSKCGTRR